MSPLVNTALQLIVLIVVVPLYAYLIGRFLGAGFASGIVVLRKIEERKKHDRAP